MERSEVGCLQSEITWDPEWRSNGTGSADPNQQNVCKTGGKSSYVPGVDDNALRFGNRVRVSSMTTGTRYVWR